MKREIRTFTLGKMTDDEAASIILTKKISLSAEIADVRFWQHALSIPAANVESLTAWYKDVLLSSSSLIDQAESEAGLTCQCCEGCSACCTGTLITISYPEALVIKNYVQNNLTRKKREYVLKEINAQIQLLTENGLARSQLILAQLNDLPLFYQLRKKYCSLRMPCPFLWENRCLIYPVRPLDCWAFRQYASAEFCHDPEIPYTMDYHNAKELIEHAMNQTLIGQASPFDQAVFDALPTAIDAMINHDTLSLIDP